MSDARGGPQSAAHPAPPGRDVQQNAPHRLLLLILPKSQVGYIQTPALLVGFS